MMRNRNCFAEFRLFREIKKRRNFVSHCFAELKFSRFRKYFRKKDNFVHIFAHKNCYVTFCEIKKYELSFCTIYLHFVSYVKRSVSRNTKLVSHGKWYISRNTKLAKQTGFFRVKRNQFFMKISRITKRKNSSDNPTYLQSNLRL